MTNKTLSRTLLVVTLALSIVTLSAGVLSYADVASWTAAGPVNGTLTFTGLAASNYNTPLVVSPLQFAAGASQYLTIFNQYGPGSGNFLATYSSMILSPTSSFNGTIYGIGFNLGCYSCSGTPSPLITVTDSASNVFTFNGASTPGYLGFRSDLAISTINISYGAGNYVAVDDVGYGSAAQNTPEAATLLLIGTGLGLMARFRRHMKLPAAVG